MNVFLKLFTSIPVIFLSLYLFPILGILLIILRNFVYKGNIRLYLVMIIFGLLSLMPKYVSLVFNNNYLSDFVKSELYGTLFDYSKLLVIIGVIFLLFNVIFSKILEKIINFIKSYIMNREKEDLEVRVKNDMEIRLKQEKAKNTSVIYCPYCGADNVIYGKSGVCKYCRRNIKAKNL